MIGLDTNVLLRIFIDDDPQQTAAARRVAESAARGGLLVSVIVLVEFVWTLRAAYKIGKNGVAEALAALLTRDVFVVEDRGEVEAAVKLYRAGDIDPADSLVALRNRRLGATRTVSFDRRAVRNGIFQAIDG